MPKSEDQVDDYPRYMVKASNFMVFHTILRESRDFSEALKWSRRLTDSINEKINTDLPEGFEEMPTVFAYSVFYCYYEQYLTMWDDTLLSLGVSLAAIFGVTFLLLGKMSGL